MPCLVQANQTSTPFYSTASEQLAALRERSRNNQRRYRSKQRDKLKEAEELVAQLTAQLKASKLEQVRPLLCVVLCMSRVLREGAGVWGWCMCVEGNAERRAGRGG